MTIRKTNPVTNILHSPVNVSTALGANVAIQLFTPEGHVTTAGNTLIKPPIAVHQFPNGTTLTARRTIGPAGRATGSLAIPMGRPAGRTTGSLAFGRPAGRFPSRRPTGTGGRGLIGLATVSVRPGLGLGARGRGPCGLATPYPGLRSFRFGDEVIEEKAVLLLFKVEVVELNEEYERDGWKR
jgi:hypothetical protein